MNMQKISPCLWFDSNAQQAADFYVSIFKSSKVKTVSYYPKAAEEVSGKKAGSVMTVVFEIAGQEFTALNGGPIFTFTEAISFMVSCESQAEIDYYWEKLSEGGDPKAQQCGWLKDKFGVSWQIVPSNLSALLERENAEDRERAMAAMLKMKKLDIKTLKKA